MLTYPIPSIEWINEYALLTPSVAQTALSLGLALPLSQTDLVDDPDASLEQVTEQERLEVRDAMFPILLLFLYVNWFSVHRPRAALENLALDFRDVPSASFAKQDILGFVAGVSEGYSETASEQLVNRIEFHRALYKYTREYVAAIYPTARFLPPPT